MGDRGRAGAPALRESGSEARRSASCPGLAGGPLCRPRAAPGTWNAGRVVDALRMWTARYGDPPRAFEWAPTMGRAVGLLAEQPCRWEREYPRWPSYTTVCRYLGDWHAALAAAGLRAPRAPRMALEERASPRRGAWPPMHRRRSRSVASRRADPHTSRAVDGARDRCGAAPARRRARTPALRPRPGPCRGSSTGADDHPPPLRQPRGRASRRRPRPRSGSPLRSAIVVRARTMSDTATAPRPRGQPRSAQASSSPRWPRPLDHGQAQRWAARRCGRDTGPRSKWLLTRASRAENHKPKSAVRLVVARARPSS
jgi:hypothetical protein